ncbi:poly-gamma-glutamate system protein [Myxococcota bacterium]|nr:poly-gamma-glutamate system protein [Myxococcota bacterium]MBU1536879.1 poly-gamma-glutamate system protein [Myxococcota bacterium]
MKKLYWKPNRIHWNIHLLLMLVAIICFLSVEFFKTRDQRPYHKEKMQAAHIMQAAMETLKNYRVRNIAPIDKENDPLETGLIGQFLSPVTSSSVPLEAKKATINPNWAAVMVHIFKRAKVKRGNTVAAAFSGSFPAMNLAVLCAAEAMGIQLVIVSSVSSSTWGANWEKFTWLDMEKLLYDKKIISNRTVAASLGGIQDKAFGMSKAGKKLLREAIERNNVTFIDVGDRESNVDRRMTIYHSESRGQEIKAFVNVGGGTISVGNRLVKMAFTPGLNQKVSKAAHKVDSMLSRFAREDVPVIYINQIRALAKRYKMPFDMKTAPVLGEGEIFYTDQYRQWLVALLLLLLTGMLIVLVRQGYGHRIFSQEKKGSSKPPEPMV